MCTYNFRAIRSFFIILSVFCGFQSLQATFSFSSRDSRIRLMQPTSQLILNTAMTGYSGTLEVFDANVNRIQGSSIGFDDGRLESGTVHALISGQYDPTGADTIRLQGGNRLRCEPGTVLPSIVISGSGNSIEGQPRFTSSLVLTDSNSSVRFALQEDLSNSVILNNGSIILDDALNLGDGVLFLGTGVVDCDSHSLSLPAQNSTWASTLYFQSADSLEMQSDIVLTGTWVFGPNDGTSVLNGNAHILDMSGGATLWVRSGHGLALSDITIKGLGGTGGYILMEDNNSTLTLNNCTLQLDTDYTFSSGIVYVKGSSCNIITSNNLLRFAQMATLSVDGVALTYETLTFLDRQNIVPFPVGGVPDGVHVNFLNGGLIRPTSSVSASPLVIIVDNYQLNASLELGINRILEFVGTPTINNITLDGNGFLIQFPRQHIPVIQVANGKHVIIQNLVLRDFSASHVSLGAGSTLIFGGSTQIELAQNEELSQTWTFSGGTSRISGRNAELALDQNAIAVWRNTTLQIEETNLTGIGQNRLHCLGQDSKIEMNNGSLTLSENYSFTIGAIDIRGDVTWEGFEQIFAYTSPNPLTILTDSTLRFDRYFTFSYDSQNPVDPKAQFVFQDPSSRLWLDGSTFYSTHTGARFDTGIVVIENLVIFKNEARNLAEAQEFYPHLVVDLLGGAILELDGELAES